MLSKINKLTKISKTFDFFDQKSKKNNHVFLGALIWNHPLSTKNHNDKEIIRTL